MEITLEGKTYQLKHKLTVKQVKLTETMARKFGDLEGRVEREGEDKVISDLRSVTESEANFLFTTIADCLGITQDDVDNMEYMHAVGVFNKLLEVSIPAKNSDMRSAKPTTGTTSPESTTFKPIETLQPKQ